tara:strand:- start:8013 stop:9836 length:1824 start_codon:yes stop_codon:yes gene_type:complete
MTDSSSLGTSEEQPGPPQSAWFRRTIIALFVVAACVRAIDVWRPIDGSVRQSWRETDTGAIARNFYREDMNILLPRIDWRGDGPGYVESEFPLFPWTAACLYHVFGYHEEILRVISYLLSLGSCLIFLRLAKRLLPRSAIIPAWAVFALSPMAVQMASAIQPEPLMFFAYLLAIDAFIRWIGHERKRDYVVALLATTLAILAKVPAAHVGILFACLCLQKFGTSVFRRRDIWLFGVVSLGVPLAWYWHAHSLWLEYGNSLGISNEAYHRISTGNFLMTLWETIPGVISIESAHIWMGLGLFFGMLGLRATRRSDTARPLGYWTLALAAFFVVTGRTTGENWAAYYHIVSTPLAAMLIGLGYTESYLTHVLVNRKLIVSVVIAANVSFVAGDVNAGMIGPLSRIALFIGATAAVAGLVVDFENSLKSGRLLIRPGYLVPCRKLLATGFITILVAEIGVIYRDANPNDLAGTFQTAVDFSRLTNGEDLIVVGGASEVDQHGLLRAADPPYYFFWMDRKGFILHNGDQSIARLHDYHRRGARYFVAERALLDPVPGFELELRQKYEVLEEHGDTMLIDLGPPGAQPSESSQASATSDQPRDAPGSEAADT